MNLKKIYILAAVLILSTAAYTIFIFIPNTKKEVVNTQVSAVVESIKEENKDNPLSTLLPFSNEQTYIYDFEVVNRELPSKWINRKIYFKYTYLGEYTDNTLEELNTLLKGEYSWRKQLDADRNIVLGGPIFLMDNVYQLHTHNALTLAERNHLLGDLLHYYYKHNQLEGTRIKINGVQLEAKWLKDAKVLEDNSTPDTADLIISTCLEQNGDRRLISGWKVVTE